MKRQLQIIRKYFLVLFWALRFRIYRVVDFVRAYLAIERSGLFDAEFYRKTLAVADRNRRDPYPLVHYLAKGAREAKDPHPLFDTARYLMHNPDVADAGSNPLIHYLVCGAHEGRNPHPMFDTAYYLRQYPDVADAGSNPLIHYLECGAHEGRNPHPLFDTAYYLKQHPDVVESGLNPLVHYLERGANEDRNPHPLFDTAYYLKQYPNVVELGLNPLVHYFECGAYEDRNPNPLFDSAYYRNKYKDVLEAGVNPLAHYLECGAHEDRKPNPLFDTAYYLRQYPDVAEAGMNPLAHYLECGDREYRNPNPLFDTAHYLKHYPDVAEAGVNPLAHYLECGAHEDRKPNPLFDTGYYLRQYPDVAEAGMNPLAHYLECGAYEDRNPNPLFDSAYYRNRYGDVLEKNINPLVHYLEYGAHEDRNPNPLFDTAYYLRQYPDVIEVGMNPLAHYLECGAYENRNPNPLFDSVYYRNRYGDVLEKEINPLVHYLEYGAHEDRKPNPLFDTAYYLEMNSDVAMTSINPLAHYLLFGVSEGRKPNPFFDSKYYLEKNPDVVATSENPLAHYLEKGAAEGRDPGPDFNTAYYLEMNPDVAQAGDNALIHYLEYGIHEGRYPNNVYELWIRKNRLTDADRKRIIDHIQSFSSRPTFSLIVPVYNTNERWLRCCLDSVLKQLYPDWELCIADDASTDPTVRKVLEEYRVKDPRIRVVFRQENGHISVASNSALDMAAGEFVALLDHDDEIAEDALYENAVLLNEHPDADMIYSDEDKLTEEGKRHSPFFKPDWSPDTFLSQMYTCHLGVYRTKMVRSIGGFRVGFEGSQDYDLVLRLTERTQKIYHIPKILYHWRSIPGSTALAPESKDYAHKAGLKALQEALARRGEGGWVEGVQNYPNHYIVHYPLKKEPFISILIPTRDNAECLDACLHSITTKTTYSNYEILVLDNGSIQEKTKSVMDNWRRKEPSKIRVIPLEMPFNYSRLNNVGADHARGELLLLLNDDVTVMTSEWLQEMASQASRSHIGVVGAHLLYPDDTIQHVGVILGMGGIASHSHCHANADSPGYYGWLLAVTNYAAVTGACLMVKKDLYLSLKGLDESLAVAYNDVDFCLRLLRKGHYNVTLPQVRLHHAESKSRGKDDCDEKMERFRRETEIMQERWGDLIKNDPFYNPNLTRKREDFSFVL